MHSCSLILLFILGSILQLGAIYQLLVLHYIWYMASVVQDLEFISCYIFPLLVHVVNWWHTCAHKVIQTLLPQCIPIKNIQLAAACALREHGTINSNVPLKDTSVCLALFHSRSAEVHSTRAINCSISILRTRVARLQGISPARVFRTASQRTSDKVYLGR